MMKTKTIFLTLCVGLALLGGCGRSKPQTSKTAEIDTSAAQKPAVSLPPDQPPPKSATAQPTDAAAKSGAATSFGPLPLDQASSGRKTRQEEIALMWQKKEQKHEPAPSRPGWPANPQDLQNPPQNDGGQSQ